MKTIALIPARGGSKRIPHKNIKHFFGKPIIAYPIQNALKSGIFDEVVVSTDCEQIASVARELGASVPFMRPKDLSDDSTPTIPVVAHAARELNLLADDRICCIYPATPLLQSTHLLQAKELLDTNPNVLYVFGALQYACNPLRAFKLAQSSGEQGILTGRPTMLFEQFHSTRSQDLEPIFHDSGQFYFGKAQAFIEQQPIFAPHSLALIIESQYAIDIDTQQDWERAEWQYRINNNL
ncbi:pseudaminic acid cytidylyltransferase [Helicobacter sp. 23-1046]